MKQFIFFDWIEELSHFYFSINLVTSRLTRMKRLTSRLFETVPQIVSTKFNYLLLNFWTSIKRIRSFDEGWQNLEIRHLSFSLGNQKVSIPNCHVRKFVGQLFAWPRETVEIEEWISFSVWRSSLCVGWVSPMQVWKRRIRWPVLDPNWNPVAHPNATVVFGNARFTVLTRFKTIFWFPIQP